MARFGEGITRDCLSRSHRHGSSQYQNRYPAVSEEILSRKKTQMSGYSAVMFGLFIQARPIEWVAVTGLT